MEFNAEHRTLVSSAIAAEPVSNLTGTTAWAGRSPYHRNDGMERKMGRGILLWLLGVPIPVIILLWLFLGR